MSVSPPVEWTVERLHDRLVAATFTASDLDTLVALLAEALVGLGYAPGRVNLAVLTLHPLLSGIGFAWTRTGGVTRNERPWGFLDSAEHLGSPLHAVMTEKAPLRLRLHIGEGTDRFAILQQFVLAGATDYVAMPICAARGDIHVLTAWTDRAGGWTDGEVAALYTIAPVLAVAVDLFEGRRLAHALAHSHEALEVRVRERTADLEAKNRRLAEALDTLQRAQEQLIQAEKMASLGLLVAGIAHELKNPLNFVNNFAELSIEYVEEIEGLTLPSADTSIGDALREPLHALTANLRRIREHGRRADATIRTMLMHARERHGEPIDLDVNGMLVEYTNLAYHSFRALDRAFVAEIVTHLDPSIGSVVGTFQELGRVVVNLVSNACYAMRQRQRQGEPAYRAVLRVSSLRLGDRIELTVADNGTGLAPEAARRLFDPFFTTKPPGEGTGLGLSLSYEIVVKELGGAIDVTSSPDEGATFTVRVPLADAQGALGSARPHEYTKKSTA